MANIVRFDPFAELNALQKQFFGDDWGTTIKGVNIPTTDVYTDENSLTVEAHLPNFDEKDIDIHVENSVLIIQAEKHEKEEDKKKKYVIRESSSSFYRRVQLPARTNSDDIEAHLDDGILKVVAPLTVLPKPQKITVKTKARK